MSWFVRLFSCVCACVDSDSDTHKLTLVFCCVSMPLCKASVARRLSSQYLPLRLQEAEKTQHYPRPHKAAGKYISTCACPRTKNVCNQTRALNNQEERMCASIKHEQQPARRIERNPPQAHASIESSAWSRESYMETVQLALLIILTSQDLMKAWNLKA